MKKIFFAVVGCVTLALVILNIGSIKAAANYVLYGESQTITPGNGSSQAVLLKSTANPGFGGIDYVLAPGTTFANIQTLSTDLLMEADDACSVGSPRFQINVMEAGIEKDIWVYLGDEPSNTCIVGSWTNEGNELAVGQTVDTSELVAGTFYDPIDQAMIKYGSYPVVGVQLQLDSGWAFPDAEQTMLVDNTTIGETIYTYEPEAVTPTPSPTSTPFNIPTDKDQCKKDGWKNYVDNKGKPFKNQGDCVSFVVSQKTNNDSDQNTGSHKDSKNAEEHKKDAEKNRVNQEAKKKQTNH